MKKMKIQTIQREEAIEWFNQFSSDSKTRLCDINTEIVGRVRRWETLTGMEIELLYISSTNKRLKSEHPLITLPINETLDQLKTRIVNDKFYVNGDSSKNFKHSTIGADDWINAFDFGLKQGANWQKQQDEEKLKDLIELLEKLNKVEEYAFGLSGFNAGLFKEELQTALTKAKTIQGENK